MPQVYNRKDGDAPDSAVYIGRGSVWGNPFKIGMNGSRDNVCDQFEQMVEAHPEFKARVKRALRGKDLVCFCKPKRCHGDYLLRIANE